MSTNASGEATRFALWSGITAALAGLALLAVGWRYGSSALLWGLLGFAMMVAIGVVGGAWTVSRHGTAGSGFLLAMGVCMLSRLLLSAAGALAAATRGKETVYAYLAGLGGGYVPMQLFEMSWFFRKNRREAA